MDCSNLHVFKIILSIIPERIRVHYVTQRGRVFASKKQGQYLVNVTSIFGLFEGRQFDHHVCGNLLVFHNIPF